MPSSDTSEQGVSLAGSKKASFQEELPPQEDKGSEEKQDTITVSHDNLKAANTLYVIDSLETSKEKALDLVRRGGSNAIAISCGYQLHKIYRHQHGILSVAYNENSESFLTVDSKHVNLWNEHVHEKTEMKPKIGIAIYVSSIQKYFATCKDLTLSIYNANFKILSTVHTPAPVLSLQYCEETSELLCGGISNISFYKYTCGMNDLGTKADFEIKLTRVMNQFMTADMWIYSFYYYLPMKKVYVMWENNVWVYDTVSGNRVDILPERHLTIISCCMLTESTSFEYFITGAKDGTINLWQDFKHLVFTFDGHGDTITGLLSHPHGPLIVSSSLDCTIRTWNIATLEEIYRLDTLNPVLGIGLMDSESFFSYTSNELKLWNFNNLHRLVSVVHSDIVDIQRVEDIRGIMPPRIMMVVSDGSIQFLSCITCSVITVVLPILCTSSLLSVNYCFSKELVYCLFKNGEIWLFTVKTNPGMLHSIWKPSAKEGDLCTSVCVFEFVSCDGQEVDHCIFAGAQNGQVYLLNPDKQGSIKTRIQAHGGEVVNIFVSKSKSTITSLGDDKVAKVWQILPLENNDKLKLLATVHFRSTPFLGVHFLNTVAVGCKDNSFQMDKFPTSEASLSHSLDDDHSKAVTSVSVCESLHLYLTSSTDGTIKVWDTDNSLIREMNIGIPITSASFLNAKGDILLGVHKHLSIIPFTHYLPINYLSRFLGLEIEDDKHEPGIHFDTTLEFWVYSGRSASSKHFTRRSERALQRRTRALESPESGDQLAKAIEYERRHNKIIKGDEGVHLKSSLEYDITQEDVLISGGKEKTPKRERSYVMELRMKRKIKHSMNVHRFLKSKLFEHEQKEEWLQYPDTPTCYYDSYEASLHSENAMELRNEIGIQECHAAQALLPSSNSKVQSRGSSRNTSRVPSRNISRSHSMRTGAQKILDNQVYLPLAEITKDGLFSANSKLLSRENFQDIQICCQDPSNSDKLTVLSSDEFLFQLKAGNEVASGRSSFNYNGVTYMMEDVIITELTEDECDHEEEEEVEQGRGGGEEKEEEEMLEFFSVLSGVSHIPNIENAFTSCVKKKADPIIAPDGHIPNSVIRQLFLHLYKAEEEHIPQVPEKKWAPKPLKPRERKKPELEETEAEEIVEIEQESSSEEEIIPTPPREPTPPPVRVKTPIVVERSLSPVEPILPQEVFPEVVLHPAIDKVIHKQWYPLHEEVKYDVMKVVEDLRTISSDVQTTVRLREDALEALGYLHEEMDEETDERIYEHVVQQILHLCNDQDFVIRCNAIKLLRKFKHSEDQIIRQLIINLNDINDSVRKEALISLVGLGVTTNDKLVVEMIRLGLAIHSLEWIQLDFDVLKDLIKRKENCALSSMRLNELTSYWFDEISKSKEGKRRSRRKALQAVAVSKELPIECNKKLPAKHKNERSRLKALVRMVHKKELMFRSFNPAVSPDYYKFKPILPPIINSSQRRRARDKANTPCLDKMEPVGPLKIYNLV